VKTPEFNNVLRRVALSFLLLAVQACGTAQKYPNISGEAPTKNGQAVLHLVANDYIGEAKGFRLLSVNGIDVGVPAGDQIGIPVGDVDLELEIEWSNEIVEQLTIKFDAEAQATYKLAIYELLEPTIEPQVSSNYSPDSVGDVIAEVIGETLKTTVIFGAGLYLIPTMPIWVPIVESLKDKGPFQDCCFVWVEKVDGDVTSGDVPPDDSDYAVTARLHSLRKRLDEGDYSRELKIELAQLGYTEPLKELAEMGDLEAQAIVEANEAIKDKSEKLRAAKVALRAIMGSAEAQFQMYSRVDTSDPIVWLCRAADGGHPYARYRLGLLHEKGIEGVEQNYARARMWYVLASESGHPWGKSNADRIQRTATMEDVKES